MPFSEADGEGRSCKRYLLKKEGKLGLMNLSIASSLRASEVNSLAGERVSHQTLLVCVLRAEIRNMHAIRVES